MDPGVGGREGAALEGAGQRQRGGDSGQCLENA